MNRPVPRLLACSAAAALTLAACSNEEPADVRTDYDRNLDREVAPKDVQAVRRGTPREEVERKLGGRGGRQNDPARYPEPKGLDCFYYTELGGVTFYRFCYRRGKLADKQQVIERGSGD